MTKQKVLIVGGGFSGVKAALDLAHKNFYEVTLLSDDADLRYYPTLYHTATGGKLANSSIPLKSLFEGSTVKVLRGVAEKLDRQVKAIITAEGQTLNYDVLILGLGVVTNYFGIPGLDKYAYGIKTQSEVSRFKAHLHQQITDEKQPDIHYVIVGAGATGIELAGALPGYIKYIMKKHGIRERKVHVDIIEALPRLLPRMPKQISRAVRRRLRRLGVSLYLGKTVEGLSANELTVSGKPIRSHTVIWTAGVTNHLFFKENDFVLTKHGKVAVDIYLQAEDNIFVIGDNANTPYSGMAQTALEDGSFVAKNLNRRAREQNFRSYIAKKPVSVVPAGPYWAAVNWGKFNFNGRIGWLLREAADLGGFHKLEPWPEAAKQFMTEFVNEDNCPVCAVAPNN